MYEERLRQAQADKRAEWPEYRAQIMRRWVAVKRAREEQGEPFMLPDPPPMDCPHYFLSGVIVADVPVNRPPEGSPEAGRIAPGVDALGRPTHRLLTPEEQFSAIAREKEGLGDKVKRALGG